MIKDAQKHFQINDRTKIVNLLDDIHQNNLEVKTRMRKMKEARKI